METKISSGLDGVVGVVGGWMSRLGWVWETLEEMHALSGAGSTTSGASKKQRGCGLGEHTESGREETHPWLQ